MRVRRVLMTADALGGVWTYALELARGLPGHNIEVALATMGPAPTAAQRAEAARIPALHLHVSTYKLEWMDDPWDEVRRAGEWLLSLENELRADVVHLNGYAHASLPWRAPKLVVGHSCVLSWWEAVHGEAAPDAWAKYRSAVGRGVRSADLVASPSRAMLATLAFHYGPLRGGAVIPNGRDPELFRPQPKESFVMTAGRLWDRAKNIETLERVAPTLEWPVFAAGDGGIAANVRLLGRLSTEDLSGWLARASIFALPARYEPFGLSVLEAALSGCALVLGDIPSLRENWDGAALFAPPDDEEAWSAQLRQLIESASTRAQLQEAALIRGRKLSPARMAQAYANVYRELT